MKKTLERLWDECFGEECMAIDTDKERSLIKNLGELRKRAGELLTNEQSAAFEKYIEALYEIQYSFVKKAFFKGCEFATSYLLEAWGNS